MSEQLANTTQMGNWRRRFRRARRWLLLGISFIFALGLIGRDDYQPDELQNKSIAALFENENFNLVSWEVSAISDKINAFVNRPAKSLSPDVRFELVNSYLDRAHEIAQLEATLNRRLAAEEANGENDEDENDEGEDDTPPKTNQEIEAEIDMLRSEQNETRLAVEQVIQSQVAEVLRNERIAVGDQVVPPVLFSFTEPPKKLVVSPRDRIETRYSQMLDAGISLDEIQQNEEQILEDENLSAYVTNIGGLGAFPTMVVDRASRGWILSTVAHEWCHNYLTLFPLGINYGKSHEITIINETVADILGDEIGGLVEEQFYPPDEPTPTAGAVSQSAIQEFPEAPYPERPPFNFRLEMRKTRQQVDKLLANGMVEEAEAYMEEQRQRFVDNGYRHIRVLNQAYFAFHGSYGTSAASTSTIGPKLQLLREESPDLKTFLEKVRWITTEAEIDQLLSSTYGETK